MLFHMSEAKPYVAHARYMTAGKVCKENIHLFEQGDWLVAMNGTISGFADKKANDTRLALEILKTIPRKKDKIVFMEKWEARFLCINRKTKEVIRTGKWIEKEGVQYSKGNVLQTFQRKTYSYDYYGDGADGYYSDSSSKDSWSSSSRTSKSSSGGGAWKSSNKKEVSEDSNEYVLSGGMWVTKASLSKGLYGTKKDDRVFELLSDESAKTKDTELTIKRTETIILNADHTNVITEGSGFVLVSVYGYLLSNYKCREIIDNGMFLGHSRTSAKMSMVENHNIAYMLPLADKDSKYVTMLTYQLKVDEYKKLMQAACTPNYVTPMRKTVVLSDSADTTVVSYVFILNQKSAVETLSTGARLETSKKLIEKERILAV